jgi:hypothetical protein
LCSIARQGSIQCAHVCSGVGRSWLARVGGSGGGLGHLVDDLPGPGRIGFQTGALSAAIGCPADGPEPCPRSNAAACRRRAHASPQPPRHKREIDIRPTGRLGFHAMNDHPPPPGESSGRARAGHGRPRVARRHNARALGNGGHATRCPWLRVHPILHAHMPHLPAIQRTARRLQMVAYRDGPTHNRVDAHIAISNRKRRPSTGLVAGSNDACLVGSSRHEGVASHGTRPRRNDATSSTASTAGWVGAGPLAPRGA